MPSGQISSTGPVHGAVVIWLIGVPHTSGNLVAGEVTIALVAAAMGAVAVNAPTAPTPPHFQTLGEPPRWMI